MKKYKFDVFISYSRRDTAIANQICDAFYDKGITYFIDRQGILGGMEFPKALAEAILDSQLILFLASENSYESKFCNSEVTFAFNKKTKESIIPYIVDDSNLPLELQFVFSGINWRNLKSHPIPYLVRDLQLMLQDAENHNNQNSDVKRIILPYDFVGPNFNKDYIPNFENKKSKSEVLESLLSRLKSNGDGRLYACCGDGYMDEKMYIEQRHNLLYKQFDNHRNNKSKYVIKSDDYDDCGDFFEGYACVHLKCKKWIIIDMLDNIICKDIAAEYLTFTHIKRANMPIFKVKCNNKWGLIDLNGNVLLECIYDDLDEKGEGMFSCKRYGKWCLMNEELIQLTDFSFDEIRFFHSGEAEASMDGDDFNATWGILKNNGDFKKWSTFEKIRKLKF